MNQQECTIDQALQNLEKIIAFVLVEEDFKLKGHYIAQGWSQLKVIKEAILKLGYLDRRNYKKIIIPLEQKLTQYEDDFISELELALALEDVQKLNEYVTQYKTQIIKDRKKDLKEKMQFLSEELQRIIKKNQYRTQDQKWNDTLNKSKSILILIQQVLNSKNENDIMASQRQMNQMLTTLYTSKRIKESQEEELMQIALEIEKLKKLQGAIDLKVKDDDSLINLAQQNQQKVNNETDAALQQYQKANDFVKMRRRTKVKLFFQGIFTAIGAFGGKIGASIGFYVGSKIGKKAGDAVTNQNIEQNQQ